MYMAWESIWWYHICGKLKHFLWSSVGVHYSSERKDKKCLGKSCFKEQFQVDSFLFELIFILLGHVSQGDGWITCGLDYKLSF